MALIANTPEPPYYAVIFSSHLTEDNNGYSQMADRMIELASKQPGFLGVESAREDIGITVSYWSTLNPSSSGRQISSTKKPKGLAIKSGIHHSKLVYRK